MTCWYIDHELNPSAVTPCPATAAARSDVSQSNMECLLWSDACKANKMLCYRRGITQHATSVKMLSTAAKLYEKGKEECLYSTFYILCISQSAQYMSDE